MIMPTGYNCYFRSNLFPVFILLSLDVGSKTDAYYALGERSTLGDRASSERSSRQFFDSLDENKDGKVEQSEIKEFVETLNVEGSLGDTDTGVLLPTDREIAEAAVAALDQNADLALTRGDVNTFWADLGSLLSVTEVRDWVVHGVGLPAEVGEAFLLNAVTGYDFAELVAGGGRALGAELGVGRPAHRARLLRALELRLLGAGGPPPDPGPVAATPVGPRAIHLAWGLREPPPPPPSPTAAAAGEAQGGSSSAEALQGVPGGEVEDGGSPQKGGLTTGRGGGGGRGGRGAVFPVHKFRLQRRQAAATPEHRSGEWDNFWVTVMDDMEFEYMDTGLEPGNNYVYRIQAWNLMGHSDFVYITGYTPSIANEAAAGSFRTTPPPHMAYPRSRQFLSWLGSSATAWAGRARVAWEWLLWMFKAGVSLLQLAFTALAVLGAYIRLRRSSALGAAAAAAAAGPAPPRPGAAGGGGGGAVGALRRKAAALLYPELFQDSAVTPDSRSLVPSFNRNSPRQSAEAEWRGFPARQRRVACNLPPSPLHASSLPTGHQHSPGRTGLSRSQGSEGSLMSFASDRGEVSEMYWEKQKRCFMCEEKFRLGRRRRHICSDCGTAFCRWHGRTTGHSRFKRCNPSRGCRCLRCLFWGHGGGAIDEQHGIGNEHTGTLASVPEESKINRIGRVPLAMPVDDDGRRNSLIGYEH